MPDNPASPTVPTVPGTLAGDPASGNPGAVSVGQLPGNPPTPQGGSIQPSQQQQQHVGSVTDAERAMYEKRISDLQSRADKATEDRRQALVQNADLQRQIVSLQEQSTNSIASAADAAQGAINEVNRLQAENTRLRGENQKYKALLKNPELTLYEQFIPVGGTEEEQQKVIEQLKAVREQDLQRITAGQQPYVANPLAGFPGNQQQPGAGTPNPGSPLPAVQPPSALQALYGNRPTIAPFANPIPGSTPAAMNPAGAGTTAEAINKMLSDARASGDPKAFEAALEQAKTLANTAVQQSLGRG